MVTIPPHIERLRSNVAEVKRLVAIHGQLTGIGPGRRHDVQVLNKSAVLLVVASWESFIEALILSSAQFLSENAETIADIPDKTKLCISNRLKRENHDNAIWALAGLGWKEQILAEAKDRTSRLHTPKATNIDELFMSIIGLPKLSSHWHWPGAKHENVSARLSMLLDLRHEIAHGVETSRSVTKKYVEESNVFMIRLAAISSNRVRMHLIGITHKIPWYTFFKGAAR